MGKKIQLLYQTKQKEQRLGKTLLKSVDEVIQVDFHRIQKAPSYLQILVWPQDGSHHYHPDSDTCRHK